MAEKIDLVVTPETLPKAQMPTTGGKAEGYNPGVVALVLIAIILMVSVVTYLGPILKPFLVAVFLYFSTKAAAGFLIRRRFPALLAYLTLFVAGSAAVAALPYWPTARAWPFRRSGHATSSVSWSSSGTPSEASQPLTELFASSSGEILKYVFEQGLGVLELLIMTFFYLLFILLGAGRLPQRVHRAFPEDRSKPIIAVATQIGTGMERFMQVKTLVSVGMGVSAAVLMYLFGLQGWLLWGILFFALNYITYIGSIVACVPPVILAYLDLRQPHRGHRPGGHDGPESLCLDRLHRDQDGRAAPEHRLDPVVFVAGLLGMDVGSHWADPGLSHGH